MSIGNRIFLRRNLPSKKLVDSFRRLPAANVADCMGRSCAMNPSIRLMSSPKEFMCGVAITVKARAGDNLFIHQALEMAEKGDVIVVSTGFGSPNSLIGEIIIANAQFKKLAGIVMDAPIRDRINAETILKASIPFSVKDSEKLSKSSNGTWDHTWVMKKLTENKVEIIDDCYQI